MPKLRKKGAALSRPYYLPILLLSLAAFSCTLFHNFTTYFNVIYLARQHLELYEDALNAPQAAPSGAAAAITSHQWLDEEYLARQLYKKRTGTAIPYASLTKTTSWQSTQTTAASKTVTNVHLDSAIILGSKVLADKKETKYIEDALFICGKAQYFKNDFSGAIRKFNELLFRYPETKYGTEVGMLMSRSMIAEGDFDSAAASAARVLGKAQFTGNAEQISEAHKMFSELALTSNPDSLSQAAEHLRLAEEGLSAGDAAKLAYQRGALFFLDGKWSEAEAAFREAISKTPDASTEGEAMVALGETLRREKKYSEAKQTFQNVLQKVRFATSHPAAQYEYAYTLDLEARDSAGGDLKSSEYREHYYPQVKATYFNLDTAYRATSQAIIARSRFRQAEIFRGMGEYDSASHLANLILGTKDFSSNEMNDYVNNRIRALVRFAEWKQTLFKCDTADRLFKKMRRPGSSMQENINRELRMEAEQKVMGAKWNPGVSDTSFTSEEKKLIDQYMEKFRKEKAASGSINVFAINFSDTGRFIDSMHAIAAHAHFELARAYENFDEPQSAISEYRASTGESFNHLDSSINNFRAQVLFSWVELDDELGAVMQRDSLIAILTKDYGETIYAQQAGKEYAGVRDKNSPGEVAYRNAYASLKSSGLDNAKNAFLQIYSDHKHEDVAARSLYTIGISYEEKSRFDSAVVYYRKVMSEYPFSKYADFLKPKMQYAMTAKPAPKIENNLASPQPVPNIQNTLVNPQQPGTQLQQSGGQSQLPGSIKVLQDSVKMNPPRKPAVKPPQKK